MKTLLVLLGPTAVGKTELSLRLAGYYTCPILSSDSRQFYRGIEIGTAAPTEEERQRVKHYFIGTLDIDEYYSVSDYETHALSLLNNLFQQHDVIIATGGSMLYVDALCYGIDPLPAIDGTLRFDLYEQYDRDGLEPILSQLKLLDPKHYEEVDKKNYKRVIHALEICMMTGKPYSSFRTNTRKERPFKVVRVGLERDRDELYARINKRVELMMESGLLDESRKFYEQKHLNALNTVGYKELFKYMDGDWSLDLAIEKIKRNTRIYSRQQLRWFKKDDSTHWINLSRVSEEEAFDQITRFI